MSEKKLIIGLTGHGSSGKWTVGNLLRYKMNFRHYRFDAPLRTLACQLQGIDPWMLSSTRHHPQEWLQQASLGHVMVEMAKQLQTLVGENVLEDRMVRMLGNDEFSRIVVSDVRTLRHATIIKDHGGLILRLRRSAEDLGREFKAEYVLPEKMIDATVMNTSRSIYPLKREILKAIKEIL